MSNVILEIARMTEPMIVCPINHIAKFTPIPQEWGKTNKEERMKVQYEEIEGGIQHTPGVLIS